MVVNHHVYAEKQTPSSAEVASTLFHRAISPAPDSFKIVCMCCAYLCVAIGMIMQVEARGFRS